MFLRKANPRKPRLLICRLFSSIHNHDVHQIRTKQFSISIKQQCIWFLFFVCQFFVENSTPHFIRENIDRHHFFIPLLYTPNMWGYFGNVYQMICSYFGPILPHVAFMCGGLKDVCHLCVSMYKHSFIIRPFKINKKVNFVESKGWI